MAANAGSGDKELQERTDVDASHDNNAFTQLSNYIDRNLREVQYGIYGIGVVGLAVAIRSLRVFGQFKTVAKIPKDYFRKNVRLRGIVRDVDSASGVLLVEHLPIIRLFGSAKSSNRLPVRLSGVHVGPMGSQWLKTTTKDGQVQFVLLAANRNSEAESIVTVSEGFLKERCLNLEVVKLGMGQVADQSSVLAKNKLYRKLYVSLLAGQVEAVGDKRGLWFSSSAKTTQTRPTAKSTISAISRTFSAIWNRIAATLKRRKVTSQNINN